MRVLGVYALEAYGVFKVRFFFTFLRLLEIGCISIHTFLFCRLERFWVVGPSWGITCSRVAPSYSVRAALTGKLHHHLRHLSAPGD